MEIIPPFYIWEWSNLKVMRVDLSGKEAKLEKFDRIGLDMEFYSRTQNGPSCASWCCKLNGIDTFLKIDYLGNNS